MASSWLSSFKFPPPADSIRPAPSQKNPGITNSTPYSESQFQPSTSILTSKDALPSQHIQPQEPTPVNRNRNKIIFGAGLSFFALSILITRRSLARKKIASLTTTLPSSAATTAASSFKTNIPSSSSSAAVGSSGTFYTSTPSHVAESTSRVSGPLEAVEALNIATINVLSMAMMVTGGVLWWLDINSVEEGRRFIRGGLGVDGSGRSEKEAEEDFEEWMASTLARKEDKERVREKV